MSKYVIRRLFSSRDKKTKVSSLGGVLGLSAAGLGIRHLARKKQEDFIDDIDSRDYLHGKGKLDSSTTDKVASRVLDDPSVRIISGRNNNSYYSYESVRNDNAKLLRKLKKSERPVVLEYLKTHGGLDSRAFDKTKLGEIQIKKYPVSPSTLAHEYGHHIDLNRNKRLRDLDKYTSKGFRNLNNISAGVGFLSGLNSERNKRSGMAESAVSKYGSLITPFIVAAPRLRSEGMANIQGNRVLKESGLTDEELRSARKGLRSSFGSYLSHTARGVGSALLGRAAGKVVGKVYYKLKDENKKDHNK